MSSVFEEDCFFCVSFISCSHWKVIEIFRGDIDWRMLIDLCDIDWRMLIDVSKFFRNAASNMVAFSGGAMTYVEHIAFSGCICGPFAKRWLSVNLSAPVFAENLIVASLSTRTFSGVGISIWTSVHFMDSDCAFYGQ